MNTTIKTLAIVICSIGLSCPAYAQSLYSALHLNEEREYKTEKPKVITEYLTYYSDSEGAKTTKNIKTFDDSGMLLEEERFDEYGKLNARLAYGNDTINRLILYRIFEQWTVVGYSYQKAIYKYNENYLVGITEEDADGKLLRETFIVNDIKGNPLALTGHDKNGNIYGIDVAEYFYDENKVIISTVSNNLKAYSNTHKISFVDAHLFAGDGEVYNSHGDIIRSSNDPQKESFTEYDYVYDDTGNWTEKRRSVITAKKNDREKKTLKQIVRREYIY